MRLNLDDNIHYAHSHYKNVIVVPGVIGVCEGDGAHTLADKVHIKRKLEIRLHLTGFKMRLLAG